MDTEILDQMRWCYENNRVFYSQHCRKEMQSDSFGQIFEQEVFESIFAGEIIESYPEDKPYPSVLIYGKTAQQRPLHVVAAFDGSEKIVILITVYQPNPDLWIDYRKRKL